LRKAGTSLASDGVSRTYRLHDYLPGLSQAAHTHSRPHLSLVLRGIVEEESGGHESRAGPGMFAVRGTGFTHQVRYGSRGALIVSLEMRFEEYRALGAASVGRWMHGDNRLVQNVIASALHPECEDCAWDLVAGRPSRIDTWPPRWLLQSRDRLIEENVSIASLALESKVHRVHFSRAFARAFGEPPTVYRKRIRAMRALAAAIEGKPAAMSAYDCGFSDQSHMARVLREVSGTSYKRLRSLGSEVTSVQE
jgi:AraC family transcriptional regulator